MSAPASAARAGGWSLIAAAVGFIGVFAWLAAAFGYPDVLEGPAAEVLPRLLSLGATGRAVWALYALLPLLLLPAAVGAQAVLAARAPSVMRGAVLLALLAAVTMLLGLARWPSIHWTLAAAYTGTSDAAVREAIAAAFDGLNMYLGRFLGEFVGELGLHLFFLLTALAMGRHAGFPRWAGPAGVGAAVIGLVAMWRNVTPLVALAAQLENWLLPAWMVVQGALLLRAGGAMGRVGGRVVSP
ncbi:MAG: DUF4386 family protein [Gemmatimonadales bacterium]|nr:DUF4386 family protein [Gemmatimonadales bacterium]